MEFYLLNENYLPFFIQQLVLDHCVERSTVDDTDVNLTVGINMTQMLHTLQEPEFFFLKQHHSSHYPHLTLLTSLPLSQFIVSFHLVVTVLNVVLYSIPPPQKNYHNQFISVPGSGPQILSRGRHFH